jgi:hypothetical protein
MTYLTKKHRVSGKDSQKDNKFNRSASYCLNFNIMCKEKDCRNCKMCE